MVGSAYILVVAGIFLAKALGFFRDIVFASVFGATVESDIYFQVFSLVNLVFTGIGVALSTLVIKNLNKPANASKAAQQAYVSGFLKKTALGSLAAMALLALLAKPLVNLLLPDCARPDLAMKLFFIMLPSLLFVLLAYVISGVLQNNRIFFISSIMSLPFNVILLAALLVPNVGILTLGVVTTIGWGLHIVIQLPSFYRSGFRFFAPKVQKTSSAFSSEVVFIFLSNMMFQFCFIIDKASVAADAGAASTMNYASNLFITIASVFVVAMSNVIFPSISQNYEEGKLDYVGGLIRYIMTIMGTIFLPFILVICCFGEPLIALIYERGEFGTAETVQTAMLFAIYSFGVLGYLAQELFNKVLYLGGKYRYTVCGTLAVIVLKLFLNPVLTAHFGARGAAACTAVLFTIYALMVFAVMRSVIGRYWNGALTRTLGKVVLAAAAALGAFFIMRALIPSWMETMPQFLVPLVICGVVYVGVLFVTGALGAILKKPETEGE